jgi:hypothetical protein
VAAEGKYKGYLIRANSYRLQTGKYAARVLLSWSEDDSVKEQPISADQPDAEFASEEEADDYAIRLALTWIEDRKRH